MADPGLVLVRGPDCSGCQDARKGLTMSVKLTDAQLVMLSAAARREDLCLTAPDKLKGAILTKVSERLVKLGLVREVRAKAGMPVCRRDDAAQGYALKLTAADLKAISVDDGSDEATASKETPQLQPHPRATKATGRDVIGEPAKSFAPRAGSKLARVIDLPQRSEGATITNLIDATGWLPHSAGGADRAAQARICRRPRAGRRGRFDLPRRGNCCWSCPV
jgi:hypothetical protein